MRQLPQSATSKSGSLKVEMQRLCAAKGVCDENLCKILLMSWLQWGNLPWITFRGNIEGARESDNICSFVCQTNNCRQHYAIILPRDGDDHLKHR